MDFRGLNQYVGTVQNQLSQVEELLLYIGDMESGEQEEAKIVIRAQLLEMIASLDQKPEKESEG
jgi:hypothetical protein